MFLIKKNVKWVCFYHAWIPMSDFYKNRYFIWIECTLWSRLYKMILYQIAWSILISVNLPWSICFSSGKIIRSLITCKIQLCSCRYDQNLKCFVLLKTLIFHNLNIGVHFCRLKANQLFWKKNKTNKCSKCLLNRHFRAIFSKYVK